MLRASCPTEEAVILSVLIFLNIEVSLTLLSRCAVCALLCTPYKFSTDIIILFWCVSTKANDHVVRNRTIPLKVKCCCATSPLFFWDRKFCVLNDEVTTDLCREVRVHLHVQRNNKILLKAFCLRAWTGFVWPRVGISHVILRTRVGNFEFHERRRIYWPAELLLAFQERYGFLELVFW